MRWLTGEILSHNCQDGYHQQTTSAGEDVQKGNTFTLLVGMETGAATVETNMEFPQKN